MASTCPSSNASRLWTDTREIYKALMKLFVDYLDDIWTRRAMLLRMIAASFKSRNKGLLLGHLWWFFEPLILAFVYWMLIHVIFERGGENYFLFALIGLVAFRAVLRSLQGSLTSILTKQNIVTQISLPRAYLPIMEVFLAHLFLLFGFVIMILVAYYHGFSLGPWLFYLLIPFTVQFFLLLGIGLVLSVLGVYLPDLRMIMHWIGRAWMYSTPVLYALSNIPEQYRGLMMFNPMAPVVMLYRRIIMKQEHPFVPELLVCSIYALVSVVVGLIVFMLLDRRILKRF